MNGENKNEKKENPTKPKGNMTTKVAKIDWAKSKHGNLIIDGQDVGPIRNQAVMDGSGDSYYAHAGDFRIVWSVREAWSEAQTQYAADLKAAEDDAGRIKHMPHSGILDDESQACDWDKFAVMDESGTQVAEWNQ
jgi:hypothetical protein